MTYQHITMKIERWRRQKERKRKDALTVPLTQSQRYFIANDTIANKVVCFPKVASKKDAKTNKGAMLAHIR